MPSRDPLGGVPALTATWGRIWWLLQPICYFRCFEEKWGAGSSTQHLPTPSQASTQFGCVWVRQPPLDGVCRALLPSHQLTQNRAPMGVAEHARQQGTTDPICGSAVVCRLQTTHLRCRKREFRPRYVVCSPQPSVTWRNAWFTTQRLLLAIHIQFRKPAAGPRNEYNRRPG